MPVHVFPLRVAITGFAQRRPDPTHLQPHQEKSRNMSGRRRTRHNPVPTPSVLTLFASVRKADPNTNSMYLVANPTYRFTPLQPHPGAGPRALT